MACDGKCIFVETISYKLNKKGEVISFKWMSSRSNTKDCKDDIEDGKGWFRFQRTNDVAVQSVDRNLLEPPTMAELRRLQRAGSLPAIGDSIEIKGGTLPEGLRVTVKRMTRTDFDYPSMKVIEVAPNTFKTIDINFSHSVSCKCEGNTNRGESAVRFSYDSTKAAGSKISHNANPRVVKLNADGTKEVTFTWKVELDCKQNVTNRPMYDKLSRWKLLDAKRNDGSITNAEKTELDNLEKGFKEEDKKLKQEKLALLFGGSRRLANLLAILAIILFIGACFVEQRALFVLALAGVILTAAVLVGTRAFAPTAETDPLSDLDTGRLLGVVNFNSQQEGDQT